MLKSSGAIGAATMMSRVLGMVREMVYAHFMGDNWIASAFWVAYVIPNLFRRLLGEGVLTAAFIPLFKETEKTEGQAAAFRAANAVLSGLVAVAAGIVVLGVLGVTVALWWGAPDPSGGGFTGKTLLMLNLTRIMLPYLLFVCVAAILMGLLNARGQFFVPALGPVLLNIVMIGSVLFLTPMFGPDKDRQVYGLAIGVVLAGIAQAAFQIPNLRREGFRFEWHDPRRDPGVQRVAQRMLPSIVGVAAFQLNVLFTNLLGFWLGDNVVASFNYAVRLMELPQGVFGVSLAIYLLPTLSALAVDKKFDEFRKTFGQGASYLAFINLLAAVLLAVLAEPIVRLLFERGKFGPDATQRASLALQFLAPGLVAYSLVNISARAFYALGDMVTPMRISVVCLIGNAVLAAFFSWLLGFLHLGAQCGLAAANTISSWTNICLLALALRKKMGHLDDGGLRRQAPPLLLMAALAGAAAWWSHGVWEARLGHSHLALKIGAVFVPMLAGSVVYFAGALLFRFPQLAEVTGLLKRKLARFRR